MLMGQLVLGEAAGFAALAFTGASAAIMIFRAKIVKAVGGTGHLRSMHVAVSTLAAAFIAIHVLFSFLPPRTLPVDLGYAAVALGLVLWLSGVGFLERNRDSFFLHGAFAVALISLITVHAAASGQNVPLPLDMVALTAAAGAALANAAYHARKLVAASRRR